MRFTWIALPLLFATLGGTPAALAAPCDDGADERDRRRATVIDVGHRGEATGLSSDAHWLQIALSPQGTIRLGEADTTQDGAASETPSSMRARVQWRTMRVVSLDFTNRLRHSVNGFLSSYSTACPPPLAA